MYKLLLALLLFCTSSFVSHFLCAQNNDKLQDGDAKIATKELVSGYLFDQYSKKAISNVHILLTESKKVFLSDDKGYFTYSEPTQKVIFSHINYEQIEHYVKKDSSLIALGLNRIVRNLPPVNLEDDDNLKPFTYDSLDYKSELFKRSNGSNMQEKIAIFPGSINSFQKYVTENLLENLAINERVGEVICIFEVDTLGNLNLLEIQNQTNPSLLLLRKIIEDSPKWIPAFQAQAKVNMVYSLTVDTGVEDIINEPKNVGLVPKGGWEYYYDFISRHLQYPREAKRNGEQGIIELEVNVSAEGYISSIELVRGVSRILNEEAMRVVKLSEPLWKPAKKDGVAVGASARVHIRFILQG